jgi:NAD(P)-dependent dehydrogenase (short-subunit alcohol dehydrogenase family)
MLGVARNLAAELGQYGIRVNCVPPYAVMTGISPKINEDDISQFEAAISEIGNLNGQILKAEDVTRAALRGGAVYKLSQAFFFFFFFFLIS